MCIYGYAIFSIDTCEKCFFRFEKGYKRSLSQIAPIHTACVCVFTSIRHEGFICLDQLGYQGTDQR